MSIPQLPHLYTNGLTVLEQHAASSLNQLAIVDTTHTTRACKVNHLPSPCLTRDIFKNQPLS